MIYLASPYSDPDSKVECARFDAAVSHAAHMWRQGQVVFSPIAHSHPIALEGLEGTWEQWAEFDRTIIAACSEVVVLMLPGWQSSKGVAAEVAFAEGRGLPVSYAEPLS